jgi:hypothetical protein
MKLRIQKTLKNEFDSDETVESDDLYEPDLSWLPDPDKIYVKFEESDEKKNSSIEKNEIRR